MKAISLDAEYDLQVRHGTLFLDDTQEQNAALIAETEKGEWKEHPQMGASLRHLVKTQSTEREIIRQVNVALQFDGINAQITIKDGKLDISL